MKRRRMKARVPEEMEVVSAEEEGVERARVALREKEEKEWGRGTGREGGEDV